MIYPSWRYSRNGDRVIVFSSEEDIALGSEWGDTPDMSRADYVPPVKATPPPVVEVEEEVKEEVAPEADVDIDTRMSLDEALAEVEEVERLKRENEALKNKRRK